MGLWTEEDTDRSIITGPEFAALTDEELKQRVLDLKIIARAKPMDKKRLVECLQSLNQVVAVTGDGTNDAPALKAAHVGLSMGDGTSVAQRGFRHYNHRQFVPFHRPCRYVGAQSVSEHTAFHSFPTYRKRCSVPHCPGRCFMGTQSPLTVTQMLWVNLIMDTFAAMALASLPPSQQVMDDQHATATHSSLRATCGYASARLAGIFFLTLLAFLYVLEHSDIRQMTDLLQFNFSNHKELTPLRVKSVLHNVHNAAILEYV